jgi:hypothetical protein
MAFALTYKDYLANAMGLNASENAAQPMSESQWNALPEASKWELMGHGSQGMAVNRFDPRYGDAKGETGGDADRSVFVMPGKMGSNFNNKGVQRFTDPSKVHQGDGYYSSSEENATPDAQKLGGLSDKQWALLVASLFAGGAAAGGALGAAPATTGAVIDESAGLSMANPFAAEGGIAASGTAAPAVEGGSGLGSLGANTTGGTAGTAGTAGGYGNAGMIAPGMENSAVADSMLINNGGSALAGGNMTGALSPGGLSGLAGQAANNPMGTARLIGGLASLGAAGHNGGGSGTTGGSPTDASSIIEQMARTNRVNQNTPLGTRRWEQDENGNWTVTDAMDAAEQANFQNVQGMNADITGSARARLAALLAAPPRPRADRAINAHGFNIGG